MNRTSKIAIIAGIVAVVIIGAALTVHFRLSESEKSEIESGAEQNEKESASEIANEIVNSLLNKSESEQSETGEENENSEEAETTTPVITEQNPTTNQIDIFAIEVDESYMWSRPSGNNPEITLAANVENTIQITNPTDVKHEFVITLDGKEVAASGDVQPDSSGKITINPTTTGVYEYHCEYHPDTMKGIINVES